jgi:hypothetical protein
MYNLVPMLEELARNLDGDMVISLTAKAKQKKTAGSELHSIDEVDVDDEAQDDLGVFGADDIQAILKEMKYKIDFTVFGVYVPITSENVILINHNTLCSIRASRRYRVLLTSPRRDT